MKRVDSAEDIQRERIRDLNDHQKGNGYVIYWMQRAQRSEYNHALEFAIDKANESGKPLVVLFCLTDEFKEGNKRHYKFMLGGLKETKERFKDRDIAMIVKRGDPVKNVVQLSEEASLVVTDRAYLDFLKGWRDKIAGRIDIPLIEVETDTIVPIEEASSKEEYAARTIRPKIHDKLDKYLKKVKKRELEHSSLDHSFESVDLNDVDEVLSKLDVSEDLSTVDTFIGGTSKAKKHLEDFLDNKLDGYSDYSNDPSKGHLSDMSPYLHFGQVSPLYIALRVKESDSESVEDYLEQLIVRRELAFNFVHYNEDYDSIHCLPDWAKETLEEHKDDEREYIYEKKEFENAQTHDKYWNAAQKEMIKTGKMHGYMRMYWGKKILEWSETPEEAYETALYLNNKYELDGRDPNGFAGVAWCFGKHDQGWKERKVYGKVRYMSSRGLERKFDIDDYVERVNDL